MKSLTIQIPQFLQPWLRWLVVAGVLSASAFLAYQAPDRLGSLVLLAIPASLGVILLLRRPFWGLWALIPTALLVPFEIGTGTQTTLNAAVLLAGGLIGLWLVDMFILKRKFRFIKNRVFIPLLGLMLTAVLAFLSGQLPWSAFTQGASVMAQVGGLMIFILSGGIFLLVIHQLKEIEWLEWLVWIFLAIGSLQILGRLVPGLSFLSSFFRRGSIGSVFWIWLTAFSASQTLLNVKLKTPWRLALGVLTLGTLFVGFVRARDWASGWLPPFIALGIILILWKPKLGIPFALLGSLVLLNNLEMLSSSQALGDQEYSLLTRQDAWTIILEIVKVNPVLGLGPANYYWYTPFSPIRGYYVVFNSHNQYIDLLAQTGIVGLVFYIWFAFECARLGWRLLQRLPAGFARAYVYGALGGLAGMLVAGMLGDWVLPFVYNIGLAGFRASMLGWLFLGGLVAIEQISLRSEAIEA